MARSDDDTGSPNSDRYHSLRQQLELLAIESSGVAELSALQTLAPPTGPSHPAEEVIDEDLATLRDRIRRHEDQVHSARSSPGSVTGPDLFQLASDYARLGRLQRAAGARPESVVSFVTSIDYFQQSPHELVKDRAADLELRAAYDDLVAVAREIESPSSTVTRALEHELRWPVSALEMYHLAARLTNEPPWLLEDDIRE